MIFWDHWEIEIKKKKIPKTYHPETFQQRYISSNDNTGNDYDWFVIWNIVDSLYKADIEFFAESNDEKNPEKKTQKISK